MKKEYEIAIIVGSALISAASATYAFVTGKRISELEYELKRRSDDIYKDVERRSDKLMNSIEKEVSEIKDTLKRKVDGIASSLNVDIPDDIVEQALRKAADNEASAKIASSSRKIMDEYSVAIRSEVRKSVDLAYANTKLDVKTELERQIGKIDISGIKREFVNEAERKVKDELEKAIKDAKDELEEAVDKAKEDIKSAKDDFEEELDDCKTKATEKFEEELDSIATRFNSDLERGSKIYKTISDKLGNV